MKFQFSSPWRHYGRYLFYAMAFILMLFLLLPIQSTQAQSTTFTNPLNNSGPDPWMTYYDGYYYLAATTWGGASTGLTMRKAATIAELKTATPVQIWQDSNPSRCCNYWAPEFFLLNGPNGLRWYGYFTGGASGTNYVATQYMHVIESVGTDPMGPYTYKGQLVSRNALDGTVLELNGSMYAVYSVWNSTQDLAIKQMSDPWTTIGNEVVISTPTYSWERQDGTVNEGAVALQRNGQTFIIYSASACWGPNYKLGMLTYNGGNPLSASSWVKNPNPVFQRSDANGVYAPGHNTFFKSPDGTEDWIVYHANDQVGDGCDMGRTPRIQKFTWNTNGTPNFGVPVSTNTNLAVPSGEGGPIDTPTPTPTSIPPSQDPVVWYRFDESSGTTASDSSGNGQNATLVNGASWTAGTIGNAVSLDGSNDYVSMPTGVVSGLNDFSIATWVRLDSISSWSRVFDFGTGETANMFLTPQNGSTNAVRFAITTSGNGGEQQITGSSALPTGQWVHVAVTKSGNTGTLYVNGSVVGTNNSMTLSPSSMGSTNQNYIGQSQYADPYLDGRVDDFRIYNRALSSSEVDDLASGGNPTPTPTNTPVNPTNTPTPTPTNTPVPSQDPAVWYEFDESSGTTASDSSGNGQNATLVNGPTWVSGQIGNAVNLDGSNDYVSMPSGVVSGLNDFSIATWVQLDSISSWSRIFDFGTGSTVNMFLTPQNGATSAVRFAITTGGNGGEQQITGSSALPTGTWTHVAVTKSGNTGTLYVNGSVVGTNNSMTLSPSSMGSTTQNYIGQSQYSDPYLDGQVDDFRIYNRALSSSEVNDLASGGADPTPTPTNTPVGPTNTPTPTSTPSSSTTYQAEDAEVGGGSTIESNHTGYNGSGFVNFPSSGGYVEYQHVDGGSGGSVTLEFRFALGASSARTGSLMVNGSSQNITFQPTGSWDSWNTLNVTVNLNSGSGNTIRFQSTGQDLANQDQMTVN